MTPTTRTWAAHAATIVTALSGVAVALLQAREARVETARGQRESAERDRKAFEYLRDQAADTAARLDVLWEVVVRDRDMRGLAWRTSPALPPAAAGAAAAPVAAAPALPTPTRRAASAGHGAPPHAGHGHATSRAAPVPVAPEEPAPLAPERSYEQARKKRRDSMPSSLDDIANQAAPSGDLFGPAAD